jgi:outer membrane protein
LLNTGKYGIKDECFFALKQNGGFVFWPHKYLNFGGTMKSINCKIFTLAAFVAMAAFLSLAFEAQAQTPSTIGVFDLQKVLNDSKKGKSARSGLETKFKKMQNELKTKENELNKLSGDLRKQVEAKSITPENFRKKDEELKKKVSAYQEQLAKYNEDMRKSEEAALKPLVDKAVAEASNLGRQRGYVVVLEIQQAGVVFAADGLDMTAEVMKAVDK